MLIFALLTSAFGAKLEQKLEVKFDKYKVKEVYKGEIKIPKSYKKDEEGFIGMNLVNL